MTFSPPPLWKEAPFIRILIPFITGILVQWYFKLPVFISCYGAAITFFFLLLFPLKNISSQYRGYWIYGILMNCLLLFAGSIVTFIKDGSNHPSWITRFYTGSSTVVATLNEPLSEKPKSFKASASVLMIETKNSLFNVKGNVIIYFQKDSLVSDLQYGSTVVFKKSLQEIKNSGNPGSFDYQRYCAFQQIYYQVYLKSDEYKILPARNDRSFKRFLFDIRKKIIGILRHYIPGEKESGLSEALLIGYKDDLDKNLVQAYSNTGVVHVIAISGLHVGLIYWLLTGLLTPFLTHKHVKWLKPLLVISGLWVFSLLAGGSPSVLRSAVMFTAIVLGETMSRRTSVYNSLAASAFLLLCHNPFWLWDLGFQLSYTAVLSIIIFMKPVYNCWFIKNKLLDAIWKLNAVTLSAQILTIPICLYNFHQFPNFFLITNLVAVPLSSVILIGELLLCIAFPVTSVAQFIGSALFWLIRAMNIFIEYMDSLPFSVLENIQIEFSQTMLLYVVIISSAAWLLKKAQPALLAALTGVLAFAIVRANALVIANNQKKLIVYNVPNHQAIDLVEGRNYLFRGDSTLLNNNPLKNFHLKPSRIIHRIKPVDSLTSCGCDESYFYFSQKSILILKSQLPTAFTGRSIPIDVIIISKNPAITITKLNQHFSCRQIIFDSSNSPFKIAKWKAECDELRIPYHSVPDKGAFVMNMN